MMSYRLGEIILTSKVSAGNERCLDLMHGCARFTKLHLLKWKKDQKR